MRRLFVLLLLCSSGLQAQGIDIRASWADGGGPVPFAATCAVVIERSWPEEREASELDLAELSFARPESRGAERRLVDGRVEERQVILLRALTVDELVVPALRFSATEELRSTELRRPVVSSLGASDSDAIEPMSGFDLPEEESAPISRLRLLCWSVFVVGLGLFAAQFVLNARRSAPKTTLISPRDEFVGSLARLETESRPEPRLEILRDAWLRFLTRSRVLRGSALEVEPSTANKLSVDMHEEVKRLVEELTTASYSGEAASFEQVEAWTTRCRALVEELTRVTAGEVVDA